MNKVIIIRWGELHLKGKNRGIFEKMLEDNIKNSLSGLDFTFKKISGRYLIENFNEYDVDDFISRLKKVGGVYSVSVALAVKSQVELITCACLETIKDKEGTFKVETNRADKKFEMPSVDFSRQLGGKILKAYPHLKVDVHSPDFTVHVDIRESGYTLVYTDVIMMMGGMPSGSSGKGLLLISGGIDSPVAGYLMAKRGMKLEALHFHSYPYTSESAKEKVVDLAKMVGAYTGGIKLHVITLTEIQEEIHKNCPEEYMITLMRRFMMKIAEIIAKNNGLQALITGESLGQVASQTIESITSSGSVVTLPVLRPLIAFDKIDIIKIAEQIETYETSILPYEDCCTVFLPKHPLIKPNLKRVMQEESNLNVELLIENALSSEEIIEL
ncbi:MAG: tRNA 4-thiouridine(8) synthase ThiI [Clostridia bacterium]|nr:tRNA 4-thiouridine(8) synthase ThiI [Clostridia bacterium]